MNLDSKLPIPLSIITEIAMDAHQLNKAYCEAIGDTSQVSWGKAEQWQKDSAINGVIFHITNQNVTPEQSHINWLGEKLATGWKYGPVKNVETKEHPCCVSYAELTTEQKVKDHLFKEVCISGYNRYVRNLTRNA